MEFITKEMLKNDFELQMKLEQKNTVLNPISEADEYLYKKFDYKNFNNSHYFLFRPMSANKDEFPVDFAALTKNHNKQSFMRTKMKNRSKEKTEKYLIDKNTMNIKAVKKTTKSQNKLSFTEETSIRGEDSFSSFLNESSIPLSL